MSDDYVKTGRSMKEKTIGENKPPPANRPPPPPNPVLPHKSTPPTMEQRIKHAAVMAVLEFDQDFLDASREVCQCGTDEFGCKACSTWANARIKAEGVVAGCIARFIKGEQKLLSAVEDNRWSIRYNNRIMEWTVQGCHQTVGCIGRDRSLRKAIEMAIGVRTQGASATPDNPEGGVVKSPQWLNERMEAAKAEPAPTDAEVKEQMKASSEWEPWM